jgi:disulfide oxidoreductase YuzD
MSSPSFNLHNPLLCVCVCVSCIHNPAESYVFLHDTLSSPFFKFKYVIQYIKIHFLPHRVHSPLHYKDQTVNAAQEIIAI